MKKEFTNPNYMNKLLIDSAKGCAAIEHYQIPKGDQKAIDKGIAPGKYVRLLLNGRTIMSNTKMEYETNRLPIDECFGDVLIAGLGLGIIPLAIQHKRDVSSITIIEKYQDVIDIVVPQLPLNKKVTIVQGDAFAYTPNTNFDYIYLDIWFASGPDIFMAEMLPLMLRYLKFLKPKEENPNRVVRCWAPEKWQSFTQLYLSKYVSGIE